MLLTAAVALALSSASASPANSPPADPVPAQAPAADEPGSEPSPAPAADAPAPVPAPVPAASPAAANVLHAPAAATLALGSTATAPDSSGAAQADAAAPPGSDPFQTMNREFFKFNQHLDRNFVGPTARTYKRRAPTTLRRMLHNFVTNFGEPVVLANDMLQLRPKRSMTTAFRFIVNTTAGIGGLFDPARHLDAEHHDNDFGITLGRYGAPPGPYLYIPLLGPSDLRDSLGAAVDGFLIDPLAWAGWVKELEPAHPPQRPHPYFHHHDSIPNRDLIRAGEGALSGIDTRARVDEDLEALMGTATDPYATMRSVYLQNRATMVNQARWTHSDLPDFDTPADPSSGPSAQSVPSVQSAQAAVSAPPAAVPAGSQAAPRAEAPAD